MWAGHNAIDLDAASPRSAGLRTAYDTGVLSSLHRSLHASVVKGMCELMAIMPLQQQGSFGCWNVVCAGAGTKSGVRVAEAAGYGSSLAILLGMHRWRDRRVEARKPPPFRIYRCGHVAVDRHSSAVGNAYVATAGVARPLHAG